MSDDAAREEPSPTNPAEVSSASAASWKSRVATLGAGLSRHWFVGLITVALLAHAAALWVFAYERTAERPAPSGEVDLGRFEFRNVAAGTDDVNAAAFSLHIRFLDEVEPRARRELADHRFRVEQDIEEILRQARAADFADPQLRELKRQLQEQINRTLALRSVADVIVTDLDLRPSLSADPADFAPNDAAGETDKPAAAAQMADEASWGQSRSSL